VRVKIGGYGNTVLIKYLYPSPNPSRKGSGILDMLPFQKRSGVNLCVSLSVKGVRF